MPDIARAFLPDAFLEVASDVAEFHRRESEVQIGKISREDSRFLAAFCLRDNEHLNRNRPTHIKKIRAFLNFRNEAPCTSEGSL